MSDSVALRPSSSPHSWVWNLAVSTRPSTTRSWSATSTSVRTCTPTLSSPVEPPCTPVLPIVCRRKSPPLPHPPLRSRSLPHLSVNTPSGSVAPSWLLCPPSNRCGSPSRNTTSPAPASSTASASKSSRATTTRRKCDLSHSPCSNTLHYDNTSLSDLEAFLFLPLFFFFSSSTIPLQFLFIYSLSLSLSLFLFARIIDWRWVFISSSCLVLNSAKNTRPPHLYFHYSLLKSINWPFSFWFLNPNSTFIPFNLSLSLFSSYLLKPFNYFEKSCWRLCLNWIHANGLGSDMNSNKKYIFLFQFQLRSKIHQWFRFSTREKKKLTRNFLYTRE